MSELNYKSKILDIIQTMRQWNLRKLTPIIRIVVLKTLISPKMNHFVSTLPNPYHEFLQKFDKVSFKNKSVLL